MPGAAALYAPSCRDSRDKRLKMARQRAETYYAVASETLPHCIVTGCTAPVVAEVHIDCYADALERFRGIRRGKVRSRRPGDERFFTCQQHMDHDFRMAALQWQRLLF
jgi:hypothetical protein